LWTLPPERSKNGKARLTPLIGLARELVEPRMGGLDRGPLFTTESGGPLYSGIIAHHLRKRQRLSPDPFVSHDLRRTAATRMAEIGIPLDLVAAIIGHESATGRDTRILVRHYLRTDLIERKAAALDRWDKRLRAIIAGEASSNVIGLRRKTG
jgi:integrase